MKKLIVLLVALCALAGAAQSAPAASHTVAITKAGFVPSQLTVAQGDSVTWTNSDTTNHQVISQDGGFSSPVLTPGQTYSFTFTKAGKFTVTDPLAKNSKMMVTVSAGTPQPAGGVSLAVAPNLVTYGGRVTLSGALSNQKVGDQVSIEAQPCGASAFTNVTTATTTTAGAFSYAIQPLKNTTYQVKYKNATSTQVAVRVRPRITLGKVAPRRFTVRVRAGDSFAGKAVAVQRFNSSTNRWVLVRSALLRSSTAGVAPTVESAVTFTLSVRSRTRVRVTMSAAQAGSCYAPGVSNAVLS
jgi:plastocyanin